jgi:hypothetical protein
MNKGIPEDLAEEIRVAFSATSKHPPYLVGKSGEALVKFFRTDPFSFAVAPLLAQAVRDWILLMARFAAIYGMFGIDLGKAPPPTPFMKKLTKLDG